MTISRLEISLMSLLFTTSALAHQAGVGPNGGMRADAAPYRVDLAPNGTKVDVYVTLDANDSIVATETMTGTAILVRDGKPVRTPLPPRRRAFCRATPA